MQKIAIAVHGGAGILTSFIKQNEARSKSGLAFACEAGYQILKEGGSALDAIEKAICLLEDDPYFNAGRGSALNTLGEVEMDAAIMNGETLRAGAVSMVRGVKNPISLARQIMLKTRHVYLSGYGALLFAKNQNLTLKPPSYFITTHQYEDFEELKRLETETQILKKTSKGTVGAVALDMQGNIAAGTSTGGTANCMPGRVGDSCMIGAGCYANNKSAAISATGEGEYIISGVIGHTIAMYCEKGMPVQEACDEVLFNRNKETGEIGLIALNALGEIGISFNTPIMRRAWIGTDGHLHVGII